MAQCQDTTPAGGEGEQSPADRLSGTSQNWCILEQKNVQGTKRQRTEEQETNTEHPAGPVAPVQHHLEQRYR